MKRQFYVGDPAPDFEGRTGSNPRFYLNAAAGHYLVLSFMGSTKLPGITSLNELVHGRLQEHFNDQKACFFGIMTDPADESEGRVQEKLPGIRYFWDLDRRITDLYTAAEEPYTLVLDPLMRVVGNISLADPEKHNEQLAELIEKLPPVNEHAGVPIVAPVLVLPRVFEPRFCQELIRLYQLHGGEESGFMREKEGNTVAVLDYGFKRRKDFKFDSAPEYEELRAQILTRLRRRLLPEIHRAFQFHVTRIERYLVACYEGEQGGFFRAHRDNTTRGTAHRRFACSINLNAEEFEGGNLRFPEFGNRVYRAPTGGAVVFSCSLLHEATPVKQGTRYAFLPFFYDEAAAKIRQENRQFLSGEVVDQRS